MCRDLFEQLENGAQVFGNIFKVFAFINSKNK